MNRNTSGDFGRTSNGAARFASTSPSGRGRAFGNTKSGIMPAPNQEESKAAKAKRQSIKRPGENDPDGPNPLRKLNYFDEETFNHLRYTFDLIAETVESELTLGGLEEATG